MKNSNDAACEERQSVPVLEDETLAQVSGMGDIKGGAFGGLPKEQLIGRPLQAVAEAQENSLKAAKDFLETIGEADQLKQKELLL